MDYRFHSTPGIAKRRCKPDSQIATLEEARRFLKQQFGIVYQGVSGLSRWCKRHRIKLKTGRRRHAHASEEAQGAFKK